MWLLAGSQPHALHSLKRFFWRRPIVINHFGGKGASPALPSTPPFTQAPRSHPRPKALGFRIGASTVSSAVAGPNPRSPTTKPEFPYVLGQVQVTTYLIILLLGASATLLSWRHFCLVFGTALVGWNLIAPIAFSPSEWLPVKVFGGGLFLSTVVCAFAHRARLSAYRSKFRDQMIHEQQRQALDETQHRYEAAVSGANDGLWYWDLKAESLHVSSRWLQMLGLESGSRRVSPNFWFDAVDPYYLPDLRSAIASHLGGESAQLECKYRIRKKDGTYCWVLTRGLAAKDASGKPVSIAGSLTDIAHAIEIERRLVQDALRDSLTGLANRHCFMAELQAAVSRSRCNHKPVGLIFLDLDDFKVINDSLGHLVGDEILAQVGARLLHCQQPGDTLARYGGDEFVLLLDEVTNLEEAEQVSERIRRVLSTPFHVGGHDVRMTASMGISLSDAGVTSPEDLLRDADIAMYAVKARGKGQICTYSPEMHGRALGLWEFQNRVREVVDREQFWLHYQPIVTVDGGRIVGTEALLRWDAHDGSTLSPLELIRTAEEIGLVNKIGEWVLREACTQASAWQRSGLRPIPVAVNVSAHQLKDLNFPQIVSDILRQSSLEPQWLELEITETAMMSNIEVATSNLQALVTHGVRLSIDDFGTGYSSLSYLGRVPSATIKIDGSFVANLSVDPQARSLTKGIISLAHSLDMKVTAEAVENAGQLEFLASEGCDKIQGHLVSMPLSGSDFEKLLRTSNGKGLLPGLSPAADTLADLAAFAGAGKQPPDLAQSKSPTLAQSRH